MYYFLAVKEIVELFAEQELGSRCEINIPAVISYVESFKFASDTWGIYSKDEIYQLVTDDILAGYPVWQLLNVSEWTRQMLQRELDAKIKREREEAERKYKCYSCKYFVEKETQLGAWVECKWKPPEEKRCFSWKQNRGASFEFKTRCKNYERRIDE